MSTETRNGRGVLLLHGRRLSPLVVAIIAATFLPTHGAIGVTIDTFDGDPVRLQTGVELPLEDETFVVDDSILGAERDLVLRQFTEEGHAQLLMGNFDDGSVLDLSLGSMTSAEAVITWDGLDGSQAVDPVGLGGVDLTVDGNQEALTLAVLFADLPVEASVKVYSDADNASIANFSLASKENGAGEEIYKVLFGDFETLSGNGAEFSNVGAIQLTIGGTQTAFDLQIDLLEQSATIASPEPGTAAIASLALLGLFVSSYRSPTKRKRR